jgi:hypothetical protein
MASGTRFAVSGKKRIYNSRIPHTTYLTPHTHIKKTKDSSEY